MTHRIKHALHRSLNRERYRLLDGLLHNQTLTRAQLLDKQARELAGIIRFAFDHTAFYSEKYAGLPDLNPATLPVLRKDEVIRYRDDMVARELDKSALKIGNTSGSTVPVVLTEAVRHGRVKAGALVLTIAFGVGLSWAATVFRVSGELAAGALPGTGDA